MEVVARAMNGLTGYALRNLWARKVTTALTAGGMALVSFVFAAVLMLAEGLEATLADTGSPANAIVLRAAAETEVASVLSRYQAGIIEVKPQVRRNEAGEILAAKEAVVLVTLPKKGDGSPTNVVVRGVDAKSMALRPQVRLRSGRHVEWGAHEAMAGAGIARRMKNAIIGGSLKFALTDWRIVGIFDAGATAFASEVWVDVEQLLAAFRRTSYSALILRVPGRDRFEALKRDLARDPRLTVQIKREVAFYREQSAVMARFIRILGVAMTIFFSLGAILGAMVTMHTAVATRTREIGTLRALGFTRRSILIAFLTESLSLGLIGGLIGVLAASLLQFVTISTMNWNTFSELAFGFQLTSTIALIALGFGVAMGALGGVLPALAASRLRIVDALAAS